MKPDRVGLFEKVKRILETVEEKLDDAKRDREIMGLLASIDKKIDHLGGGGGSSEEREAEIVALLETEFRPIIDGLKSIGA